MFLGRALMTRYCLPLLWERVHGLKKGRDVGLRGTREYKVEDTYAVKLFGHDSKNTAGQVKVVSCPLLCTVLSFCFLLFLSIFIICNIGFVLHIP